MSNYSTIWIGSYDPLEDRRVDDVIRSLSFLVNTMLPSAHTVIDQRRRHITDTLGFYLSLSHFEQQKRNLFVEVMDDVRNKRL